MADDPKGSGSWAPWVAGAVLAALAVAAVFAFLTSPRQRNSPTSSSGKPEVERGSACEELGQASDALDEGQDKDVVEAIKTARSEALRSLEEGGVVFGKPEEVALKLKQLPLTTPFTAQTEREIAERLSIAREACSEFVS